MNGLRKHFRIVSLLVIATLLAGPLARSFCQVFASPLDIALERDTVICVAGDAAKSGILPAGKHKSTHDCAVCLALAFATAPAHAIPIAERLALRADASYSGIGSALTEILPPGGVGSRAPPFIV